jgi:pimeloyl-ACP methyl ester carboxylesterase
VIHGVKDKYVLASGHNDSWKWIENDLTMVMVRDANHFVQHQQPEFVTKTMLTWLGKQ